MKRLIIHVGIHKTGTTYLQKVLHKNADLLLKHGFYYPQIGIIPYHDGQHNLAWEIANDPRYNPQYGNIDDLINDINKLDPKINVVLSSEDFINCRHCPKNFSAFLEKFKQFNFEVSILIYLRNHVDLIRSKYIELIKLGLNLTFRDYLDTVLNDSNNDEYNFPKLLENLRLSIPDDVKIFIKSYDTAKSALFQDFQGVLGKDLHLAKQVIDQRHNSMYPLHLAMGCFYFSMEKEHLSSDIIHALERTFKGLEPVISKGDQDRIINHYSKSWKFLETLGVFFKFEGKMSNITLDQIFSIVTLKILKIVNLLKTPHKATISSGTEISFLPKTNDVVIPQIFLKN